MCKKKKFNGGYQLPWPHLPKENEWTHIASGKVVFMLTKLAEECVDCKSNKRLDQLDK